MSKTRIGKIARLPRQIRNELNRRLHEGERGDRLVQWLNAQAGVQAVLAAEFGGRAINPQNLSDWKQGGYRDWLTQQEALELAERLHEDAGELQGEGLPPLTDRLALWATARLAVATRWVTESEGEESWRRLRELSSEVVELRKGDHSAERLRLERERLDFDRQRRLKTDEELMAWAMENRERICRGCFSDEEKAARLREIFGLGPNEAARANQGESSPIKPSGAEKSVSSPRPGVDSTNGATSPVDAPGGGLERGLS